MLTLDELNNDCFNLIISDFSKQELLNLSRVNRALREKIYSCAPVWRTLSQRELPHLNINAYPYLSLSPRMRYICSRKYTSAYVETKFQLSLMRRDDVRVDLTSAFCIKLFLLCVHAASHRAFPSQISPTALSSCPGSFLGPYTCQEGLKKSFGLFAITIFIHFVFVAQKAHALAASPKFQDRFSIFCASTRTFKVVCQQVRMRELVLAMTALFILSLIEDATQ